MRQSRQYRQSRRARRSRQYRRGGGDGPAGMSSRFGANAFTLGGMNLFRGGGEPDVPVSPDAPETAPPAYKRGGRRQTRRTRRQLRR